MFLSALVSRDTMSGLKYMLITYSLYSFTFLLRLPRLPVRKSYFGTKWKDNSKCPNFRRNLNPQKSERKLDVDFAAHFSMHAYAGSEHFKLNLIFSLSLLLLRLLLTPWSVRILAGMVRSWYGAKKGGRWLQEEGGRGVGKSTGVSLYTLTKQKSLSS